MGLVPYNWRYGVGITAKWALIPKLRPFKANKCLNSVSIKTLEREFLIGPKWPFRTLKIDIFKF